MLVSRVGLLRSSSLDGYALARLAATQYHIRIGGGMDQISHTFFIVICLI